MLVCSVVQANPVPLGTSYALVDLLMRVSTALGQENRGKLAAAMHRAADDLEGCTRPVGDDRHALH
jgi:hypothetical protein